MKKIKHLEFILTTSLFIILITLVCTYLCSAIFIYFGITFIKIFSIFLLQAIFLIISTNYILKKFYIDYFNDLKIKGLIPLRSITFSIVFSMVLIILLFSFDYLFSWIIDFKFSYNLGEYMDGMLKPSDRITIPKDESFTLIPITIQNIFLNLVCLVMIIFISKSKYKISEQLKFNSTNM